MTKTEEKKHMPRPFTKEELVEWRTRMGYTQDDAAEALGCSNKSINSWENGDTTPPKYIGLACDALSLGITR